MDEQRLGSYSFAIVAIYSCTGKARSFLALSSTMIPHLRYRSADAVSSASSLRILFDYPVFNESLMGQ